MLFERYKYDSIPVWDMTPVQLKYRKRLLYKIENNIYKLQSVKDCICGSRNFEQLAGKDRFGLPVNSNICTKCGLITSTPRISLRSLGDFYDYEYNGLTLGIENAEEMICQTGEEHGDLIFNFLDPYLSNSVKSLAEIGCGSGHNLAAIQKHLLKKGVATELYGCDYSSQYVKLARELFNVNAIQGNIESLIKTGVKVDVVILSHLFEHLIDLKSEMKKIKRILNTSGIVYIEVPGILDLKNKFEYDCDFLKYLTIAHTYNFSLGTLTNTMMLGGFDLISGSEFVRSVFKISDSGKKAMKNYYNEIISYLKDVEMNRGYYQSLDPKRKKKQVSYRLLNRLKSIVLGLVDSKQECK